MIRKCAICAIEMSDNTFDVNGTTYDHITPISRGGSKLRSNTQEVCRHCNSKKHNRFSHEIKISEKTDFKFLEQLIHNEIENLVFNRTLMEKTLLDAKAKYEELYQCLFMNIDDILSQIQEIPYKAGD